MNGQARRAIATRVFALLGLALAVCIGLMGTGQASAAVPSTTPNSYYDNKVEKSVLQDTEQGQNTEFVVLMNEQADLSSAYGMKDQNERGWFVYNTLRATADRSQAPLKAMLAQRNVGYHSYWAANMLVVRGDRSLVDSLAARSDVKVIESNRSFQGISDPVGMQNSPVD